jgi:hypothetical protein
MAAGSAGKPIPSRGPDYPIISTRPGGNPIWRAARSTKAVQGVWQSFEYHRRGAIRLRAGATERIQEEGASNA